MDTKDIIKQAFSQLGGNYSCPDHETAFNDVLERAKKMKKDDNVKQMQFTEITPEYIEPKKSTKVLHAVAGVAGAAAVLAGAVFGLKFLNEHGGLKEGGSDEIRAGYHEDITTPLSADMRETGDNAIILATFVYDDFTVNITGYDFDGISLKVYYDTIFPDDCTLSSGERIALVLPMIKFAEENSAEGYGELISETENTQSCIFRETLEEYTESLKVDFKPNKQGYAGSGGYPYTVYADHKKPEPIEIDAVGKAVNGVVPMDETIELDDVTVHFTGYEFDSVSVKLYYSIIFGEDTVVEPGMQPPISPVDSEWTSMYGADETRKNVMNVTSEFLLYEPVDPARISFTEPESGETLEVTLHCDRDSLIERHERTVHHIKFTDGQHDRTIFEDMYITPTHALAVFNNGYKLPLDTFNEIDLEAETYDGEITLKEGRMMTEGNGKVYVKWEFEDPTNLAQIKNVTLFSSAMTELGIGYSQTFVYGEDYERSKKDSAEASEIRSIEHSPLFTPADEWFDYEHCRAHVTGYIFDGLNGRIRYEVYHDYPVDLFAHNSASICNPNTFTEGDVLCSGGETDYDRELEGIAVFCYDLHVTEPVDEITIPFCSKWGSAEEQEMTKNYSFTLRYNSDVPRITNDIDKELTFDWGDTVHLDSFVLTPDNLGFRFSGVRYTQTAVAGDPEDIENDPAYMYHRKLCELETVITFKNGETAVINNKTAVQPSGMPTPDGNAWMFWQFRDSIDISEVASITVDGLEIYSAENSEMAE